MVFLNYYLDRLDGEESLRLEGSISLATGALKS